MPDISFDWLDECPAYDFKQSDDEAPVILEVWGGGKYPFIAITPRSTLTRRGSIVQGPLFGSNRTVRHLNWEQTNDLY